MALSPVPQSKPRGREGSRPHCAEPKQSSAEHLACSWDGLAIERPQNLLSRRISHFSSKPGPWPGPWRRSLTPRSGGDWGASVSNPSAPHRRPLSDQQHPHVQDPLFQPPAPNPQPPACSHQLLLSPKLSSSRLQQLQNSQPRPHGKQFPLEGACDFFCFWSHRLPSFLKFPLQYLH